jgi:hypothetical protein
LNGEPRSWDPGGPAGLLGRPAPPLTVRGLDGQLHTLLAPSGRSFLAYFRDTWVVPYVGKQADTADLEMLAALLTRRPDLRERIAMIVPYEKLADLTRWIAVSGVTLPVYSDESGALSRACGDEPPPFAVVIDSDRRIGLIRAGFEQVMGTDWETIL